MVWEALGVVVVVVVVGRDAMAVGPGADRRKGLFGKSLGLGVAVESLCAEEVHSTAGVARKGGESEEERECVWKRISEGRVLGPSSGGAQRNEPDGVGCSESSEKREMERRERNGRAATKGEGASGRAVGGV